MAHCQDIDRIVTCDHDQGSIASAKPQSNTDTKASKFGKRWWLLQIALLEILEVVVVACILLHFLAQAHPVYLNEHMTQDKKILIMFFFFGRISLLLHLFTGFSLSLWIYKIPACNVCLKCVIYGADFLLLHQTILVISILNVIRYSGLRNFKYGRADVQTTPRTTTAGPASVDERALEIFGAHMLHILSALVIRIWSLFTTRGFFQILSDEGNVNSEEDKGKMTGKLQEQV